MHKNNIAFILILAISTFICSCTTTKVTNQQYKKASITKNGDAWSGYIIKSGVNIIFIKRSTTTTVPFLIHGISGYSLIIELYPDFNLKGDITIPSDQGRGFLKILTPYSTDNLKDVQGNVKVLLANDKGVNIEIDLYSKEAGWSYYGIDYFKTVPIECFESPNSSCYSNENM